MFFKWVIALLISSLCFLSCNKKCKEHQGELVGTWYGNNSRYYFNNDASYSYKFLGAKNPGDSISVADSTVGTYVIDQCQKVASLTQKGYYSVDNPSVYVPKNINFATWKYKLQGDTVLNIETPTSFLQLKKLL